MFLYIEYPTWIQPEIFPGVPFLGLLRWYGLMYVFAFATAYIILTKVSKEGALDTESYKVNDDDLFSFIGVGILFLIIGARVFSTLVYDTSKEYWSKPWLIFWPFKNGHFTGLSGMSYHGGFIGGLIGMLVWCRHKKQSFWKWSDAMCTAIPLGYTFGRIGNFLNGELYGRITTMPWGIKFPNASRFSASAEWVQEFCAKIGMNAANANVVNLPRHPSQLYEAFFEGIVLWLIIWACRKHKKFDGMLGMIYTAGYGFFRFFIEYFREPDSELGFRITGGQASQIWENTSLLNISTGQILCFLMILFSIICSIILYKIQQKQTGNKKEVQK